MTVAGAERKLHSALKRLSGSGWVRAVSRSVPVCWRWDFQAFWVTCGQRVVGKAGMHRSVRMSACSFSVRSARVGSSVK